jgi:hypothetical protein
METRRFALQFDAGLGGMLEAWKEWRVAGLCLSAADLWLPGFPEWE